MLLSSGTAWASSTEVILPVQFHHQEHALSCEAAALKMVFDYYGLKVSESDIIQKMPLDLTPHQNGVWGDPNAGFVGDIDGKMAVTGYGIYWKALQQLSSNWKKTDVIEGGSLADLTAQLEHRHPVIVWGYKHSREATVWKTKDGRAVAGVAGEHTRVVYGFRGEASAPAGFFVMDPISGSRFWPSKEFLENWKILGRTGIVVRDEAPVLKSK